MGWGMESGTLRNGQICYSSFTAQAMAQLDFSKRSETTRDCPWTQDGKRIMCMYNEPITVRSATITALLERSLSTPQRQISLITPRSLLLALVGLGKMSHQSTNDVPDV